MALEKGPQSPERGLLGPEDGRSPSRHRRIWIAWVAENPLSEGWPARTA